MAEMPPTLPEEPEDAFDEAEEVTPPPLSEDELDDAEEASPPASLVPVVRPPDVEQAEEEAYQQTARGRITAFPFAMGLITLGGLLLAESQIEGFEMTLPIVALILIASLVLTNLFRFFASGRQERGLFFLALVVMFLGGVIALMSTSGSTFDLRWWPLTLVGTAAALFVTFTLERQHERGLLGLGLLFLASGGIALLVTLEAIPQETIDQVADFWPLAIAFIGITLIPLALRRAAG